MTTPDTPAREAGSTMYSENSAGERIELSTACRHSLVTCHTDRCFRLPPDLRAERDRMLNAATTEYNKALVSAYEQFTQAKRNIEAAYRRLAANGQPS
jgi:hypothetical protein